MNKEEDKKMYKQMCQVDNNLPIIRQNALCLLTHETSDFWNKYEAIKGQLKECVGHYCPDSYPEWMQTSEAWDIAYQEIFEGLL